jgi:hypothetical protein
MAIYKLCCSNPFAMPEVANCPDNIVIPGLGTGTLFTGEWLEFLLADHIQHIVVCLPLLIQPLLRNIAVPDRNRQESDRDDEVCCGHLAELRR